MTKGGRKIEKYPAKVDETPCVLTVVTPARHFEFGLSPITRLLIDVFARNLAGVLNFTSYIQLYY